MMFRRWKQILGICLATGALGLAACGDDAPPPAPPQPAAPAAPAPAPAAQAPAPAPEAPAEVTAEAEKKPPQYAYDESVRDPFQPATTLQPVESGPDCGPLCQFDVNQFKISGIIWGIAQPAAMLKAPDGKPYIVKVGTPIGRNKGKVVSITKERIAVLEKYVNYRGEVVTNRVDIEVPEQGGSLK